MLLPSRQSASHSRPDSVHRTVLKPSRSGARKRLRRLRLESHCGHRAFHWHPCLVAFEHVSCQQVLDVLYGEAPRANCSGSNVDSGNQWDDPLLFHVGLAICCIPIPHPPRCLPPQPEPRHDRRDLVQRRQHSGLARRRLIEAPGNPRWLRQVERGEVRVRFLEQHPPARSVRMPVVSLWTSGRSPSPNPCDSHLQPPVYERIATNVTRLVTEHLRVRSSRCSCW